ncbi:MAG: hypothetical protein WC830_10145 [Burkholderiales bacterium]|jgi:hypothetical protein
MNRPSFQFYPGDWLSNAKLKCCTHAERGIWISVLCLMHDSTEYGVLRWSMDDFARAVGCKASELRSLAKRGVLKGGDTGERVQAFIFTPRHANRDGEPVTLIEAQSGPLWYSSRMVRDEYVRTKRGIGSRFGDEPKNAPKPPIGDGPSSSSSSSTSLSLSHPPSGSGKKRANGRMKKLATTCPEVFDVTDAMVTYAINAGLQADRLEFETQQFLDHHRAKGSTFSDWSAAWRKWIGIAIHGHRTHGTEPGHLRRAA